MRRPGPRPAPLGRPGHISGVPSRPKHPAQPLALDVGSPRAAQVTGNCINSSHVTRSPHPTGPACSHDQCAFVYIFWRLPPARFANGRGPVPFRDAGLRGRRDRRWPGTVARGGICHHVGAYENPRAPRRTPASAHPRASCAQPRARSPTACSGARSRGHMPPIAWPHHQARIPLPHALIRAGHRLRPAGSPHTPSVLACTHCEPRFCAVY